MVEIFFVITRQAIRRGSFKSAKQLVTRIKTFIEAGTIAATHSSGTKPADEILRHAIR